MIKPRNNIIRDMIKNRKIGGAHLDHHKEDLMHAVEKETINELFEEKENENKNIQE